MYFIVTRFTNLLFILMLCLPLIHCAFSDDVVVRDRHTLNYKASLNKEMPNTRLGLLIEHQGTQGEGQQVFPEKIYEAYSITNPHSARIRPEIITQNEFSLNSTAIAGKWNALKTAHVGINVYIGGIDMNSHVKVIEPTGKTTELSRRTKTIMHKFELYLPITDTLKLTGGVSESFRSDTELTIGSVSLDYQLTKSLGFSLGHTSWYYDFHDHASFTPFASASSSANQRYDELNFNSGTEVAIKAAGVLFGIAYTF
jgi:hypothetical protein